MSRRASLPGAAELFRSTVTTRPAEQPVADAGGDTSNAAPRRGSGRQRHDAKITVYVSDEELVALEHARIGLRSTHGLVADRGRIVREAIAALLADLETHGEQSVLIDRLRQDPQR